MSDVNINIKVNDTAAKAKMDRLTASSKKATKQFNTMSVSVKNSTSAFKVFAGNVAAIGFTKLVSGLTSFVGASVKVTGEIETLRTQFEVLTGSVGTANKAVQDLQQFAASTPFKFKDLAKAEQRLLSFGFTLEETQERMVDIGDVSAASGADIAEMALIFGQVNAAGKLTGERLLQLQERAIPIGPAIAKTMGIAESAVRDAVKNGKVDFQTFEKAFQSLNDTGEFAFEGMVKRSRTLEGRLSTLSDNFELLQANVGSKVAPAFKALITTVTLFIQKIQNTRAFNDFLETLANSIPSAITFAIDSFSFLINTVLNTIKIFNLFRSGVTTAISLVLKAFNTLVSGMVSIVDALGLGDTALGKSLKTFESFNSDVSAALDDTAAGFAESAAEIDQSQSVVNSAITKGKNLILKSLAEETAAAEAQANAKVQSDGKKTASEKQLTAEQIVEMEKRKAARIKFLEDLAAANVAAEEAEKAAELFKQEELITMEDAEFERYTFNLDRKTQAEIASKLASVTNEEDRQLLLSKVRKISADAQVSAAMQNRKRLEAIEKAKFDKLEKDSRQAGTNLMVIGKASSKGLFAITKKLALAQATVNGFNAISAAASAFPFPANIPGIIAETARSVINISGIQGQNFAQGGIVPGSSFSGDRVAANVNSGEMILNRQQQSQLFNMANGSGGGQQEIVSNVTVMLDSEVVGEAVSRQVANGLVLGEVQ